MVVDFDIDTPLNGPGGLDSFLWLFNSQGQQLSFNNNAAAPGENQAVFDAFLQYTFATAGTYYLGVSNAHNTQYDPLTGNGDTAGGQNSIGSYQLIVNDLLAPVVPTLTVTTNVPSIPEFNGTAIGTVSRANADLGQPLVVTLTSSDTTEASVPANVTIPANQSSITFTITAVDDHVVDGTKIATITATAAGFDSGAWSLQVTDSDGTWHNAVNPDDVSHDGVVSAVDALLIINYLNAFGPGPVPSGNPPPYYDVNSDNFITSIDALLVINFINSQPAAQGEGEAFTPRTEATAGSTATTSPQTTAPFDAYFAELGTQMEYARRRQSFPVPMRQAGSL
jgi:hypothetical protein